MEVPSKKKKLIPDILYGTRGSGVVFHCMNVRGRRWVEDNLSFESYQWHKLNALHVEGRYGASIIHNVLPHADVTSALVIAGNKADEILTWYVRKNSKRNVGWWNGRSKKKGERGIHCYLCRQRVQPHPDLSHGGHSAHLHAVEHMYELAQLSEETLHRGLLVTIGDLVHRIVWTGPDTKKAVAVTSCGEWLFGPGLTPGDSLSCLTCLSL